MLFNESLIMEHIVEPKSVKRNTLTILVTCGGNDCDETTEVIYCWDDDISGKDRLICPKCGKPNDFLIPK